MDLLPRQFTVATFAQEAERKRNSSCVYLGCWGKNRAFIQLLLLLSGTARLSQYLKDKPFWILMKWRWWGGNGVSWIVCKSFVPCCRWQHLISQFFTSQILFLPPNQQHQSPEGHCPNEPQVHPVLSEDIDLLQVHWWVSQWKNFENEWQSQVARV